MKILNGLFVAMLCTTIWFISDSLTSYRLAELERAGEVPYGPLPAVAYDGYLFNKNSTSTMSNYPVEKIKEFTKENFESIVLNTLPSKSDQENLRPHLRKILITSEEYQLDPFWMLSIVMVESRFVNHQTSSKNALGLMQIQPETAVHLYQLMNKNFDQLNVEKMLFNADENLDLGAFYLKKLLQNFRMNFKNATIAYNVGPNKLKNLMAQNLNHEEGDIYFETVQKNYIKFAKNFTKEVKLIPNLIDSTYVVSNHGEQLEYTILSQLGYFTNVSKGSENIVYK